MASFVLLRHGQSVWNQERRFTGWADVELSAKGYNEAEFAGRLLNDAGYRFDICFCSVLQRARKTLEIVLDVLGQSETPIQTSWRLNERHYGALQGLGREETVQRFGSDQVRRWQQQFDVRPPPLALDDPRFLGDLQNYADLPNAETIKDVRGRVLPYWNELIFPSIQAGQSVLVVAHGNSLRALTTYLDDVAEADIAGIKRPLTGEPFSYELNENGKSRRHFYLRKAPKLRRWAKSRLGSTLGTIGL